MRIRRRGVKTRLERGASSATTGPDWAATPSRTRRLVLWTALSAAALLALLVYALPGEASDWWTGLGEALEKPYVMVPAATVALSLVLWCVRTWMLRRLVAKPGPVQVMGIDDGTATAPAPALVAPVVPQAGNGAAPMQPAMVALVTGAAQPPAAAEPDAVPLVRLSLQLRERLSELRLEAPDPVPGASASTDFVELLGTTKVDIKQPLAAFGRLLRLVLPTHAYEVKATLLRRDAEPTYGVAIELRRLARPATMFSTYWAASWEDAIDRAASGIGARVVALSDHSHGGRWFAWHGEALDEELFDADQRSRRLLAEHRHEEALAALYEALRRDPGNDHIRFDLGQVQEELALSLDALRTYLWVEDNVCERLATADRRERKALERLLLLARYRSAVLLGFGERLAPQWLPPAAGTKPTRRAAERESVRSVLWRSLLRRFATLELSDVDRAALGAGPDTATWLLEFLPGGPPRLDADALLAEAEQAVGETPALTKAQRRKRIHREARGREAVVRNKHRARMRLLFQLFAMEAVEKLLREYEGVDVEGLDGGLSDVALGSLPAWAWVRAEWARQLLKVELGGQAPDANAWPPSPSDIKRRWQVPGDANAALANSTRFIDHYNAACTFAAGLLREEHIEERPDTQKVRELARAAAEELHLAVGAADGAELRERWDWILREDPDLAGLRGEPEFTHFEMKRFPSRDLTRARPTMIVDIVAARHSANLLRATAVVLEDTWHARSELSGPTGAHDALAWWDHEMAIWKLAHDVSIHHHQWQTRLQLIECMRGFCTAYERGDFAVPQRNYSDDPIEADTQSIDTAARRELNMSNERIDAFAEQYNRQSVEKQLWGWRDYMEELDFRGDDLLADDRKALADNRARAWGQLRLAFGSSMHQGRKLGDAKRRIEDATGRLSKLPPPAQAEGEPPSQPPVAAVPG
jgi:hypothetical protein